MDRLLTDDEQEKFVEVRIVCEGDARSPELDIDIDGLIKAQDAKTHKEDCKKFGEWLESKMVAVPLMGVEWHIRLDHIEALKRGEMPE